MKQPQKLHATMGAPAGGIKFVLQSGHAYAVAAAVVDDGSGILTPLLGDPNAVAAAVAARCTSMLAKRKRHGCVKQSARSDVFVEVLRNRAVTSIDRAHHCNGTAALH